MHGVPACPAIAFGKKDQQMPLWPVQGAIVEKLLEMLLRKEKLWQACDVEGDAVSTTIYCDRCNKELRFEGNGIHENVHPTPATTPTFRIHVHFLKMLNEGKADLCEACVIDLVREWLERQVKQ